MKIDVTAYNSFDQLEPYRETWNDLLQENPVNHVFMTFEYCRAWWKVYSEKKELLILIAEKESEIVGIAPLVITEQKKFGINQRVVRFLGYNESDYMHFIIPNNQQGILSSFLTFLSNIQNRWDMVQLSQIPLNCPSLKALVSTENHKGLFIANHASTPCMVVRIEGKEAEVYKKVNKKGSLRNLANRLKRMGELEYKICRDPQKASSLLENYFQQHIGRWENTLTPSIYRNEMARRFYIELFKDLVPSGYIHFSSLYLNEIPLAFNICFEYHQALEVHRTSYNPWFSPFSPGRLIYRDAIQYCLDHSYREFDVMAGMESYKNNLMNMARLTHEICIYKSKLKGRLDLFIRESKRSGFLKPFVSESKIWQFRMKLRNAIRRNGKLGLLIKILRRLFAPLFELSALCYYKVDSPLEIPVKSTCPLTVRRAAEEDLPQIAGMNGYFQDSSIITEYRKRWERGDVAYLAFSGMTLVHIAWVCTRGEIEQEELWAQTRLGVKTAYIWDCKTCVSFRGMKIYPFVLQQIVRELLGKDRDRVCIAVHPGNRASIRGIEKAGFRFLTKKYAVKLFGKKIGSKTVYLDVKRSDAN